MGGVLGRIVHRLEVEKVRDGRRLGAGAGLRRVPGHGGSLGRRRMVSPTTRPGLGWTTDGNFFIEGRAEAHTIIRAARTSRRPSGRGTGRSQNPGVLEAAVAEGSRDDEWGQRLPPRSSGERAPHVRRGRDGGPSAPRATSDSSKTPKVIAFRDELPTHRHRQASCVGLGTRRHPGSP